METYKPVVLIVMDGWGESPTFRGNPIRKAKLPTIQKLNSFYPLTLLQASGSSVGLPWGEPGNSEVGHITLGMGKIIYQSMPRITLAIQDGTFYTNPEFQKGIEFSRKNNGAVHIMGLVGQGSVHSYLEHLYALMELVKREQYPKVFYHLFTDGRDSPPTSGVESVKNVMLRAQEVGNGMVVSLCGRNWAMDRNNNWDRIEKAYRMLVNAEGNSMSDPISYIQESYKNKITDEFLEPAYLTDKSGNPVGRIQDGDAVFFFNFREDRARQLTKAFSLPSFDKIKKDKDLNIEMVTLVEYEKNLPVSVAFKPETSIHSLGEMLSNAGKRQLRISETEKYAHVTYFFNGGLETPFPKEDRVLIPSPIVSSFDQIPEMSAEKVTDTVIEHINAGTYDFILLNYANPDMVAHTGNEEATIQAIEFVDYCLERLIPVILKAGGCIFLTSDHGNAEELKNLRTGEIDTEHSINPIPLWFITSTNHKQKTTEAIVRQQNEVVGLLSDVAPTILDLFGLEKPPEMFGSSLLPLFKNE